MEDVLENSLELSKHLVNKHFDKGYDKFSKYVNGKKVEEAYVPVKRAKQVDSNTSPSSASSQQSNDRTGLRSATPQGRRSRVSQVRSSEFGSGAANTGLPIAAAAGTGAALGATTKTASIPGSRRRQRNTLPSPQRDSDDSTRDTLVNLRRESEASDRILRLYEAERDDPKRSPASVLPDRDLWTLDETKATPAPPPAVSVLSKPASRRDSAMASGYRDDYQQTQYQGEGRARSAQPPRSRYYDDDDSDYDERTGKRYGGRGRGYDDRYDDRDYDRVEEVTERYRGPPMDRAYAERAGSYRSGYDGPYGAGTVARRSDPQLDRGSYVSRRSKSGGRDRDDRDRSYSRSRSRSRSGERGGGFQDKIQGAFDTSARGLGVGLAGAVIGGLAGREFGHKHRQRDIIIGALVGGLGANAAENKWKEYREEGKEKEERWEQRFDGRSRSNVR